MRRGGGSGKLSTYAVHGVGIKERILFMKNTEELVKTAAQALSDKKGENIAVLDIRGLTIIADYFVLVTAGSLRQMDALKDSVEEAFSKEGLEPAHIEGANASNWILMDYGDIVIHIFDREGRSFYDLERIWKDGKRVEI